MWQLSRRGNQIRDWEELGALTSVADAARRILQLERDLGSVSFRVYADPAIPKSDAEILSRLEYQSQQAFYLLKRQRN